MMHEIGHGMGRTIFPGFGIVIQLLFLVVFIVIVVWLLRSGQIYPPKRESAREVLDKRLANGDIGVEEYKRLLKEISKK